MAAKLKDGLFIGDLESSQDPEFLELNKISNLVNVAGRECENMWEAHGLAYLTYAWEDEEDCPLFDDNNEIVKSIVDFVDGSIEYGISVLIFSYRYPSIPIIYTLSFPVHSTIRMPMHPSRTPSPTTNSITPPFR